MKSMSFDPTTEDEDGFRPEFERRLAREVSQIIRGAGDLIEVRAYAMSKGGGWSAVLDTEYAALRLLKHYYGLGPNRVYVSKGRQNRWTFTLRDAK